MYLQNFSILSCKAMRQTSHIDMSIESHVPRTEADVRHLSKFYSNNNSWQYTIYLFLHYFVRMVRGHKNQAVNNYDFRIKEGDSVWARYSATSTDNKHTSARAVPAGNQMKTKEVTIVEVLRANSGTRYRSTHS
jgi:hypothetical protein